MEHSNSDCRFISTACEEANKSIATYRVGCVAVASGKVVARGCNNARTYSKDGIIGQCLSCHAEIDVLRKIYKKGFTKKINLYVARITSAGELVCSAPCIDCFIKMQEFNIKDIIYIGHDGEIIKRSINQFQPTHRCGGKKAIIEKRAKVLTLK